MNRVGFKVRFTVSGLELIVSGLELGLWFAGEGVARPALADVGAIGWRRSH